MKKSEKKKKALLAIQTWWDRLTDKDIPSKRTKSSLTRPGSQKKFG